MKRRIDSIKKIGVSTAVGRIMADLHALIAEHGSIVMASFYGIDSVVRGVAAGIVSNQEIIVEHPDVTSSVMSSYGYSHGGESFWAYNKGYRMFTRPFISEPGRNIVHCVLIHERCFVSEYKTDEGYAGSKIVLSGLISNETSDIRAAVMARLSADFNVPNIPEWAHYIYEQLESRECLIPLRSLLNEDIGWLVDGVRIDIQESDVLDIITDGLREGRIALPEGNIEAPALRSYEVLADYLHEYAPYLAEKVEQSAPPLHDIDGDALPAEIRTMDRIPFPVQAHAATALYKGVLAARKGEMPKALFLNCGDMGTGKTQIANTLMHLLCSHYGGLRVLVMVPQITIPQWKNEEILKTVSYAKVTVLNNWKDTLSYIQRTMGVKPNGLEVVLIGHDRAKLGYDPWTCALYRRIKGSKRVYAWHCPDCFNVLMDPREPDFPAHWDVLAYGEPPDDIPSSGILSGYVSVKWRRTAAVMRDMRKCPHCGAILRRPANRANNETRFRPRLEPAWLMKNRLPKGHFDLMVLDEFHLFRGDSGRGAAMASLVCISKFVLGLSGTPTTGRASSIYRILERICMNVLMDDGFEHGSLESFVQRYGRLQEITKVYPDSGVHTRRNRERKTVRELPGIAPAVYVRYLMSSVFIDLEDLGVPLVELDEWVEFVELDTDHRDAYRVFHRNLESACKQLMARGNRGAYSKFLPAVLNYAVHPCEQEVVLGDPEDGEIITAPGFGADYYSAPERRLLELVLDDVAEDRCAIVYCWYTNKYGIDKRVSKVLTDHGVRSVVLKSTTVSPDERQDWIRKQIRDGAQVIVANLSLVEVGLNLVQTPSIYVYQNSYQTEKVRQATKRAHRPHQTKRCKIVYIVPDGTQCVPQFTNSVACRAQAMYLEGRLLADELARYTDGYNELTRDLSKCLASTETAQKWRELAARDTVRTVGEADFERELRVAYKRLCRITLDLCEGKMTVQQAQDEVRKLIEVKVLSLDEHRDLKWRERRKVTPGQLCLDI
jgi:hypothetical protein